MKKTILLSVFSVFLIFTSCKENATEKVNEENVENVEKTAEVQANSGKFPVMSFESTTHDFGTIEQGTHVEHVFKFTNTGDAPLVISSAKGSCGCTVPQYPKEPINPGETGELTVKFNGSGQNQRNNSVTLTTNTEKGSERLTVKAFVNPKS